MSNGLEHPVDLIPEYALGVLDDTEAATVEAHLESCESCRADYAELAGTARLLALAVEEPAPPAGGRDRLLQAVRREQAPAAPVPLRPRRWFAPLAAAAVAAVIFGLVGVLAGLALGDGSSNGRDREDELVRAAAAGTLQVSEAAAGGVSARVVHAPGSRHVLASFEGMPALPAGKAYQAWLTADGMTFEPSDVFTTAAGGAWLSGRRPIESYTTLAFTIEDGEGADTPSQAPFIAVALVPAE